MSSSLNNLNHDPGNSTRAPQAASEDSTSFPWPVHGHRSAGPLLEFGSIAPPPLMIWKGHRRYKDRQHPQPVLFWMNCKIDQEVRKAWLATYHKELGLCQLARLNSLRTKMFDRVRYFIDPAKRLRRRCAIRRRMRDRAHKSASSNQPAKRTQPTMRGKTTFPVYSQPALVTTAPENASCSRRETWSASRPIVPFWSQNDRNPELIVAARTAYNSRQYPTVSRSLRVELELPPYEETEYQQSIGSLSHNGLTRRGAIRRRATSQTQEDGPYMRDGVQLWIPQDYGWRHYGPTPCEVEYVLDSEPISECKVYRSRRSSLEGLWGGIKRFKDSVKNAVMKRIESLGETPVWY